MPDRVPKEDGDKKRIIDMNQQELETFLINAGFPEELVRGKGAQFLRTQAARYLGGQGDKGYDVNNPPPPGKDVPDYQTKAISKESERRRNAGLRDTAGEIAERAAEQIGDLGPLARGEVGGPTAQDQELVAGTIGAASDIARRELAASLPLLLDQSRGSSGARGVSMSSSAAASDAIVGAQATRSLENLLSQQQIQGGQALMQLPFQRANVQLNANQLLYGGVLGSATGLSNLELGQRQLDIQQQQVDQQGNVINQIAGAAGNAAGRYVGSKLP